MTNCGCEKDELGSRKKLNKKVTIQHNFTLIFDLVLPRCKTGLFSNEDILCSTGSYNNKKVRVIRIRSIPTRKMIFARTEALRIAFQFRY